MGSRDNKGYVRIYKPDHPRSCQNKVYEHIVVMEQVLGRFLEPGENVHHKNGIRWDNRPENLELWSRSQPYGQRVSDKVSHAIEILSTYKPEVLKDGVL